MLKGFFLGRILLDSVASRRQFAKRINNGN
jgi:hypothetical protein